MAGAEAYKRVVPNAEINILDAGHFALDKKPDEMIQLAKTFLIGNRVNEPVIGNCQLKTLDCRSVTADICAFDAIYENGKIEGFNPAAAITPEDA